VGWAHALARRCNPRREGEAAGESKRGVIGHDAVRAQRQFLASSRVLGIGGRVDDRLLDARPIRVRVAVNQLHDVGAVPRSLRAHHERDGLTRLYTKTIGVTDNAAPGQIVRDFLADVLVTGRIREGDGRGRRARRLRWAGLFRGDRYATRNGRPETRGANGLEKRAAADI